MANRQNVVIGIKFQSKSQVKAELDNIINYLSKNSKIDILFDTKQVTQSLNDFSKVLDNISSKVKSIGDIKPNSSGIKKDTEELKKEEQAMDKVNKARQNMVNSSKVSSSVGVSESIKSYDALLSRAEEIRSTMKGISKINMSVKTDGDGVKKLNQAVIVYKNNLNQTVTETMKLYDVTNDKGKVVGSEFKSTGNLKINDNIEQQQKAQQKELERQQKADAENMELYRQDEIKKTQAQQNEIDKRKQLEQNYSDMYNRILNDRDRANKIESEKQVQLAIKSEEKLQQTKLSMQNKLNNSSQLNGMYNNSFIDPSVLANIQNKLNSINTNTPEKEIKELQETINNLGSSNSGIVKVQSAISKMQDNLKATKGKYGDLVGNSDSINQLKKYESEISNLKKILESLKGGQYINPQAISKATSQATIANRNLATAVRTSSNAMRTGQQDAISFGDSLKRAFSNAGIYMSTYQVIQLTFRAIKDGISTVIEMDTALADLNKVVDLSKNQLLNMRDNAISLGKELGQSATSVASAMAEFGRLYKNTNDIKTMTKVSVLGSNVMDNTTSAQVAKSLTTIMTAMKKEVGDSMSILDSMNEIKCVSPYTVMCK